MKHDIFPNANLQTDPYLISAGKPSLAQRLFAEALKGEGDITLHFKKEGKIFAFHYVVLDHYAPHLAKLLEEDNVTSFSYETFYHIAYYLYHRKPSKSLKVNDLKKMQELYCAAKAFKVSDVQGACIEAYLLRASDLLNTDETAQHAAEWISFGLQQKQEPFTHLGFDMLLKDESGQVLF